jgi:hypothetical protein
VKHLLHLQFADRLQVGARRARLRDDRAALVASWQTVFVPPASIPRT